MEVLLLCEALTLLQLLRTFIWKLYAQFSFLLVCERNKGTAENCGKTPLGAVILFAKLVFICEPKIKVGGNDAKNRIGRYHQWNWENKARSLSILAKCVPHFRDFLCFWLFQFCLRREHVLFGKCMHIMGYEQPSHFGSDFLNA